MKLRIFLTLGLLPVLLAACASPSTETLEASSTPLVDVPTATPEASLVPALEWTPTQPVDVFAAATSRGPDLHATDPATVSLAAGQLHFVEFFRFT